MSPSSVYLGGGEGVTPDGESGTQGPSHTTPLCPQVCLPSLWLSGLVSELPWPTPGRSSWRRGPRGHPFLLCDMQEETSYTLALRPACSPERPWGPALRMGHMPTPTSCCCQS